MWCSVVTHPAKNSGVSGHQVLLTLDITEEVQDICVGQWLGFAYCPGHYQSFQLRGSDPSV